MSADDVPARRNEQHVETILDSISDGVFTVDENWRVTSFNRAAEDITGIDRADAIGRPCWDVFRASICEADCALRKTMASGSPIVNKAIYIVDADGNRVPISISTALLRDSDGNPIGGVETFRDLSTVEELRKELSATHSFHDIISKNHKMQAVFQVLPAVAASDATVLIEGESGTGKELVARAIHALGPRKDGPFVAVNCAALPDTLLESELFGYRQGAFTDARADKPGRFALAEGGTLLLDEIGDVSPALQVRLLRVLQQREYEPLGATAPVPCDVRVIAATHRDLAARVEEGSFRQDLYYRINVVRIQLPPLRERKDDIPLLIDHFLNHFNRLQGKDIHELTPDAMQRLIAYDYPGNVRELENILEHAFVLCPGGVLRTEHLPPQLQSGETRTAPARQALASAERDALLETLAHHNYNRAETARALGMHRSTLFRKLKQLGLDLPQDGRSRD